MSMYIRLKRKNQTLFLHVEPHSSFNSVKAKISDTFKVDQDKIMLYHQDKKRELVDAATISDQEIKNDDVVYFVFVKETGSGFEDIQCETLRSLSDD